MNNKMKGCLIFLLLVFITIGATSATEVSTNDTISTDAPTTYTTQETVEYETSTINSDNSLDTKTTTYDNSIVTVEDNEEIDGNGATYTNTSFKVTGNNVVLKNFQIENNDFASFVIDATGVNNLTISNVQLTTTNTDGSTFAIDFTNTTNSIKKNSVITVNADKEANTIKGNLPNIPVTLIVTQDNVDEIFGGVNYTLSDSIFEGDTLDFQGTIDRNHSLVINKPVNIISSTEDAILMLHTKAGSYFGEDPGNCFVINKGGSNSNISSLYLDNTQLWVYNTQNVYLYNMSMVVHNERVGSGVGQTALRYSNNVTMDNCLVSTENNGGSSSFVWTGTSNSTLINSRVTGIGSVGNLIYVGNAFNTNDKPADFVISNVNNVVKNCTITKEGAAGGISVPLYNNGINTTVDGNKVFVGGSAISSGTNGTIINNEMHNGCGITVTANSVAYGNIFYDVATLTAQANSKVYDNELYNVSISGAGVLFENNTVKSRLTSSQSVNINNNVINNIQLNSGAKFSNVTNNNITGTVTSQAPNVVIKANNITSSNDYTVVVTGANNEVTNNYLVTMVKAGDETVSTTQNTTVIENNIPESGISYVITDETYPQFFDENGKVNNTNIKTYDTLTLKGVFNNKVFDLDTIKVTLQGDEAVINNGYFKSSENATVLIKDLIINNTGDIDNSVIFESDSNTLRNVTIYRNSREGTSQEVYVTGDKNLIENNNFYLDVATQPVNFGVSPSISDVSAITILSSNNVVQKNKIKVNTTSNKGTLNVIDVASKTAAESNTITQNNIEVSGTDYIYGINLGINTNKNTVTSNNITLTSDNYVAGIQIMNGPSNNNTINTNNINITATSNAYGILITAWENPEVSGNIFNSNKINVTADQAYGMELYSSSPNIVIKDTTVNSNTIKSEGNYSIGIAFIGEDSTISLNTITVTGTTNATLEDSYDLIKPTTAGIILQNSENINDYNNTINVTNGANHLLVNTNNSRVISTTSTMTRYINAENNANIVLKSSNNNTINTQRAYTTGAYSVELTASSDNMIYGNILNASNILGGNSAVKQDADSTNNIVENNTPVFGLLTEETYSTLFDENGTYTYPEGVDILTLAGDLYNKDLIFNNNVTFTNSKNYTINNGTIIINENPNGSYANRFVNINNININNTDKTALIENLTGTSQRNINYNGGSITITGDDIVAIESVKENVTYAIVSVKGTTFNLNGKDVIAAKMTRDSYTRNDYVDIENCIININATGISRVLVAENVNLDILKNNITQTGSDVITAYAKDVYANSKFFGENNIEITGDNASALILNNSLGSNPTVGNNNITITSPNPVVAINITTSGNAYVGQGAYSYASYNYPNRIIVDAYNGETPVVTVTTNGYVRNNYVMAKDLMGLNAVEAKTKSNITPSSYITDTTYNQFFDETGSLKELFNNSKLLISGEFNDNTVFIFDGMNVSITSDGTAVLNNGVIWTGPGASVTLDGFVFNNTMDAIILESEGNIINNTVININSEDEIHAIYVYDDNNIITNTEINIVAPSANVKYNPDYSVNTPAPAAIVISSNNNLIDNTTITFDGTSAIHLEDPTAWDAPTVDGIYLVSSTTPIENNTIQDTTIEVTGSNYAYGINVGNAKNTIIEYVDVDVTSAYYADAIQLFDADTISITGEVKAIADSEAYGVYSTAMGTGYSKNIDLTGLDIRVNAVKATGVLLEGSSNVTMADAEYDIFGHETTAIKAAIDWMHNTPTNITITNIDMIISGTEDNNVLQFTNASDVSITDSNIVSSRGSEINFENTPNSQVVGNYIKINDVIFGDYAVVSTDADTVIQNNTPKSQKMEEMQETIDELQKELEELKAAKNTTLTLDKITDARYKADVTISGTLVNEDSIGLYNQVVTLTIGETKVNVTTKDGAFEYTTSFKNLGEKNVTATYAGTDKYRASEATTSFTVEKQDIVITCDPIQDAQYKADVTITGKATDVTGKGLNNINVVININGKTLKAKTDKTGAFTLTTTATQTGENTVTLSYKGNDNYNGNETTVTFNVEKQDIVITYDAIEDAKYKDTVTITGKVTDVTGKALYNINVIININGKTYKAKTDKTGAFTLTATTTAAGENKVTLSYAGNDNYNGYEANTTFNVEKQDITITYDPIKDTVSGKDVTITGTIKDANGNAVSNVNVLIRINTKLFKAKSDNTGAFTLTTTATTLGTNNVTLSYGGNTNLNSYETSTTFNVIAKAE